MCVGVTTGNDFFILYFKIMQRRLLLRRFFVAHSSVYDDKLFLALRDVRCVNVRDRDIKNNKVLNEHNVNKAHNSFHRYFVPSLMLILGVIFFSCSIFIAKSGNNLQTENTLDKVP